MKLLNKFIKSVFAHIWNGHDWSQYITSVQQFAIGEEKKHGWREIKKMKYTRENHQFPPTTRTTEYTDLQASFR